MAKGLVAQVGAFLGPLWSGSEPHPPKENMRTELDTADRGMH